MADPRWVGHAMRRRLGAESNHIAMAEHPDQGDPIEKTMLQKAVARAGGTVAPVPSAASRLADRSIDKPGSALLMPSNVSREQQEADRQAYLRRRNGR